MLKSGEKLRKLLMLLAIWGLLLAFFIAYERYFVTGQREFLKEDGFRALTTLSGELKAQVQKAQKSTEAFIKLAAPDHKQEILPESVLREFPHIYLRDAQISPEALQDIKKCSRTSPENAGSPPIEITPGHEPFTLSISCYRDKPDHARGIGQRVDLYTVDLVKGVTDAFEKESSSFDDVLVADSLGNVIFQKSITGADASLLKSSTKPRITNLKSLLPSSATAEPKKQDHESAEKKSDSEKGSNGDTAGSGKKPQMGDKADKKRGPDQPDDSGSNRDDQYGAEASTRFRRLIGASAFTEVTAAGKTYEMFSRPMPIPLPIGKTWDLVVVGLWDAKQFEESSRKIPYSTLIWAALIVVALLSLSWPLFKLRYMSNTERFTAIDGWYLVLALFLAATSIMLMLLNGSYIAHEKNRSDRGMETLARRIKFHLEGETGLAVQQLDKFAEYSSWKKRSTQPLGWDFMKDHQPDDKVAFPYPYFNSAAWVNEDGQQLFKFDVRSAPTPNINIGLRPYFKRAISENVQSAEGHYLEPILSANTGQFSAELAGLFLLHDEEGSPSRDEKKRIKVESLSLMPMSLVDPVLPPGYRFAVIDTDCNVLFHSDSYRNMREDFCEDSKDKDELRPWLFSGVDTPLDITYEGKTERAYLTSLESPSFALEASTHGSNNTQVFLLVFREPELDLTLNLAVILVCSVLMGAYFVCLIGLAFLYLLVRGPLGLVYMPRFLWPQRKHAVAYLQIFASNVVILLLFWCLYPRLYEAPLLTLTVVVAAVSVLLALSKLAFPSRGPLVLGVVLGALLAATILVFWLVFSHPPHWELVWILLGASCLIGVLLADKVTTRIAAILASTTSSWVKRAKDWLTQVSHFAEKHFSAAYVFAVLSVISAAGLVPCIGFFKYSYDAITELALKHDEIVVSERLIDRRDHIRDYYKEVQLPQIAERGSAEQPIVKRRINETWDRYDIDTLPSLGQPCFEVWTSDSRSAVVRCGDLDKSHCDESVSETPPDSGDDLNEVIERLIARATLRLPTNPRGAEMSKLGVASSKEVEKNWEHIWKEPAPTCFQLIWKRASRWPGLTITSRYPDWKGLLWPNRIFLLALWLGLWFWLWIVLKEIFLTNLEDLMPFEAADWTAVADIKQNFLVIERAESDRELWNEITDLPPGNRLDLRIELKKMVEDKSYWPGWEGTVKVLILDHFDFNMKDGNYNQARLNLLEGLLGKLDLKLVIISTIDPLYFLTDDATEALADGKDSALTRRLVLDRWASALSKFKKTHHKDLSQNEFNMVSDTNWVKRECDHTAKLREIGEKVLKEFSGNHSPTREWVVTRVLDLADSYYHVLWTGLSPTERLVLYQLARDGWANPKNLVAIQQLESKQLVRRNPMFQIINESFRRFVLSPEHAEEIAQWEKLEQQSTWHAMRFVVIAVGIGFAAWLLYTQAAFSQTVVGYIAAIATLLTAAGSLFGRSGRPTPAKAEGE
jgi:hypothetical protein